MYTILIKEEEEEQNGIGNYCERKMEREAKDSKGKRETEWDWELLWHWPVTCKHMTLSGEKLSTQAT